MNITINSNGGDSDLRLDFDRDAIPALAFEREALWNRLAGASFLTPNEKRAQLGYEAIAGGDKLPDPLAFTQAQAGGRFGTKSKKGGQASDPDFFSGTGELEHGCGCVDEAALSLEEKSAASDFTRARFERLLRVQREFEAEVAENSNVTFKKHWVFVPGRTSSRFWHQTVQPVGLAESFGVGSDNLFLPCDPSGNPANTFYCRCRVEYQRLELDQETGQWQPGAVKYGDQAYLTDDEIAEIIFNENSILSGPEVDEAARYIAHIVMNGEELRGTQRPGTAETFLGQSPTTSQLPLIQHLRGIVASVRNERTQGVDPTSGRLFFVHRNVNDYNDYATMMAKDRRVSGTNFSNWEAIGPVSAGSGGDVTAGLGVYLVVQNRKRP